MSEAGKEPLNDIMSCCRKGREGGQVGMWTLYRALHGELGPLSMYFYRRHLSFYGHEKTLKGCVFFGRGLCDGNDKATAY